MVGSLFLTEFSPSWSAWSVCSLEFWLTVTEEFWHRINPLQMKNDSNLTFPVQTYPFWMCLPLAMLMGYPCLCVYLFLFSFIFWNKVSLCSPRWLGTQFVTQCGLEHTTILLTQHPDCWDYRWGPLGLLNGLPLKAGPAFIQTGIFLNTF